VLAGLTTPPGLLVDRYYRGAIVMVGDAMFAVPEAAIRVLEHAHAGGPALEVDDADRAVVAVLIDQGLLVRTPG
jgi:hypothetical protein